VGAFSFALFSVLSKKNKSDSFHSVFYYFMFATIFSLISMLWFSNFERPSISSLPMIIINGGIINGLSYLLWINALQLVDSSRIAPLVFLAPVLSCIWIVLFFGEVFLPVYFVGIGLSVASGLIAK
jgi:drug/metabolite transporter (DMT)-like permease